MVCEIGLLVILRLVWKRVVRRLFWLMMLIRWLVWFIIGIVWSFLFIMCIISVKVEVLGFVGWIWWFMILLMKCGMCCWLSLVSMWWWKLRCRLLFFERMEFERKLVCEIMLMSWLLILIIGKVLMWWIEKSC